MLGTKNAAEGLSLCCCTCDLKWLDKEGLQCIRKIKEGENWETAETNLDRLTVFLRVMFCFVFSFRFEEGS